MEGFGSPYSGSHGMTPTVWFSYLRLVYGPHVCCTRVVATHLIDQFVPFKTSPRSRYWLSGCKAGVYWHRHDRFIDAGTHVTCRDLPSYTGNVRDARG